LTIRLTGLKILSLIGQLAIEAFKKMDVLKTSIFERKRDDGIEGLNSCNVFMDIERIDIKDKSIDNIGEEVLKLIEKKRTDVANAEISMQKERLLQEKLCKAIKVRDMHEIGTLVTALKTLRCTSQDEI
jgi:hypothetical protein